MAGRDGNSEAAYRSIMARAGEYVASADVAIAETKENFDEVLAGDLLELRKIAQSGTRAETIGLAYRIKGRAGTVGWPLISSAANALAKLLERSGALSLKSASVNVHLDTLELLYRENMKGEDARGQPLVRELYKIVEKETA